MELHNDDLPYDMIYLTLNSLLIIYLVHVYTSYYLHKVR